MFPTLKDMAELASAFSADLEPSGHWIESDRLRRRWKCTRRHLKNLEDRGILPRAARMFGQLVYRGSDVDKLEKHYMEFGTDPKSDEQRRNDAIARLHLRTCGLSQSMAEALEILLVGHMDRNPTFIDTDVDAWVPTAIAEVEAVWKLAQPPSQFLQRLVEEGKPKSTTEPAPELVRMVGAKGAK